VGEAPDYPEKYDLMSLIMINLGSKDKNYGGLIKMLDQLLVEMKKDVQTATDILENEYQIPFRTIDEEALGMCNLSKGIYDEGIEIGIEKGIEKGLSEGEIKGKLAMLKDFVTDAALYMQKLVSNGISEEQYNDVIAKYPDLKPDFDVDFSEK
jgi:hypothetical protein